MASEAKIHEFYAMNAMQRRCTKLLDPHIYEFVYKLFEVNGCIFTETTLPSFSSIDDSLSVLSLFQKGSKQRVIKNCPLSQNG